MFQKLSRSESTSQSDYYWQYQFILTDNYILPLLERWNISIQNKYLIDAGCGEGGATCAFSRHGAECTGIDIDEKRIRVARSLAEKNNEAVSFHHGDILDAHFIGSLNRRFQIAVLRDVVEHIENLDNLFDSLKLLLKDDGLVLISFPPYYSPFGLHQQILRDSWIRRIPFIQLLPRFIWESGVKGFLADEVLQVMKVRLTIAEFTRAVRRNRMKILHERGYAIRPSFEIRYGIKCVHLPGITKMPLLRETLLTGVYYLMAIS
jgi:SAM-dependent methyltransferase